MRHRPLACLSHQTQDRHLADHGLIAVEEAKQLDDRHSDVQDLGDRLPEAVVEDDRLDGHADVGVDRIVVVVVVEGIPPVK